MLIVTTVFADSGPEYFHAETDADAVTKVADVLADDSDLLVSVTVTVANFAVTVTTDDTDWSITDYFGTLAEAQAYAQAQPAGRFCTVEGLMR